MEIRVTATNDEGEQVTAAAASQRDALAMALLWNEQGFRQITVTDLARSYTAEEYAAKVISGP